MLAKKFNVSPTDRLRIRQLAAETLIDHIGLDLPNGEREKIAD